MFLLLPLIRFYPFSYCLLFEGNLTDLEEVSKEGKPIEKWDVDEPKVFPDLREWPRNRDLAPELSPQVDDADDLGSLVSTVELPPTVVTLDVSSQIAVAVPGPWSVVLCCWITLCTAAGWERVFLKAGFQISVPGADLYIYSIYIYTFLSHFFCLFFLVIVAATVLVGI